VLRTRVNSIRAKKFLAKGVEIPAEGSVKCDKSGEAQAKASTRQSKGKFGN